VQKIDEATHFAIKATHLVTFSRKIEKIFVLPKNAAIPYLS
jgi:hypothetical protein